jgi:hypothetical protein
MASTFNNLAPYVTAYIWRRTSWLNNKNII